MLIERKILESERNSVYVKSTVGSRLTGTVEENKNAFDKYPELIREKFNALVGALIELGIDNIPVDLGNRYTKDETGALITEETQDLVSSVMINTTTGIITVTKKNGAVEEFDTALEKIPASFELVEKDGQTYLKITNMDGTSTQTSVTSLMNVYVISVESETILVTNAVEGVTTTYSLELKDGAVKNKHLSAEVMEKLDHYVSLTNADRLVVESIKEEIINTSHTITENARLAQEAAELSINYGTLSQSYAKGGTQMRDGEDTDNSYYYSRQAALSAQEAANYKEECKDIAGGDFVPMNTFNTHVSDNVIHVTADDRERWNSKMDDSDIDCGDWDMVYAQMLAMHNREQMAHENLVVDGNE